MHTLNPINFNQPKISHTEGVSNQHLYLKLDFKKNILSLKTTKNQNKKKRNGKLCFPSFHRNYIRIYIQMKKEKHFLNSI